MKKNDFELLSKELGDFEYQSPKASTIPLEKVKVEIVIDDKLMYGACRHIDRICGHGETGCPTSISQD